MKRLIHQYGAGVLCVLLLAGTYAEKAKYHSPPGDAQAYHARVYLAYQQTPMRVGPWEGTNVPVPPAAVAMLQPNLILSRAFENVQTGQHVSFLLVQVRDARDILGHYPPVCYKGQGWARRAARERDWTIDDLTIHGMEYEFVSSRLERTAEIVIDNFMVLPDGNTCRDMEGVDAVAQDYRRRFKGAAQVQLVSDIRMSDQDRENTFAMLVRAHRKLIDEIRLGEPQ